MPDRSTIGDPAERAPDYPYAITPSSPAPFNRPMKSSSIRILAFVAVFAMMVHSVHAGMCVSLGNGSWNNAATWSCGHVPIGGDTVIIAAGHTVSITQNHVYNGLPLHIQVYGVWYFSGGGSKITLPCGSHVEIMVGGLLQPNSNSGGHSETVRICGVTYWYYDQGPQGGYQIWPPIILPVEMGVFSASVEGGSALLEWTTFTEHNCDRFEVHRSRDGLDWEFIDEVAGQGNSANITRYKLTDTPWTDGLWYYRLEQVDIDGTRYDGGMVAVMLVADHERIKCAPNPVSESHLMITSGAKLIGSEVRFVNVALRAEQYAHLLWEEEHLLMFNMSGLAAGVYITHVTSGPFIDRCTFIVQ